MSTQAGQEIPAHVLPFMDAAREKVRAGQMNPVEKSARRSQILECDEFDSKNYDHSAGGQERRAKLWAEFHALKETETASDLTPERRARLLARAHEQLPEAERYVFAYQLAKEIEEECLADFEGPSRTLKALQSRAEDRTDDIRDCLSHALAAEDILFLSALNGFQRRRDRFRTVRTLAWGRMALVDISVRVPYTKVSFWDLMRRCATLRDVKRVCACWDVACTVERRENESAVVGAGFEILPSK